MAIWQAAFSFYCNKKEKMCRKFAVIFGCKRVGGIRGLAPLTSVIMVEQSVTIIAVLAKD